MVIRAKWSPSPRKAWIETVARMDLQITMTSPSPRKAWIETQKLIRLLCQITVAFPPEGVD